MKDRVEEAGAPLEGGEAGEPGGKGWQGEHGRRDRPQPPARSAPQRPTSWGKGVRGGRGGRGGAGRGQKPGGGGVGGGEGSEAGLGGGAGRGQKSGRGGVRSGGEGRRGGREGRGRKGRQGPCTFRATGLWGLGSQPLLRGSTSGQHDTGGISSTGLCPLSPLKWCAHFFTFLQGLPHKAFLKPQASLLPLPPAFHVGSAPSAPGLEGDVYVPTA